MLQQWFLELDSVLTQTRAYWQLLPFAQRQWPWPELSSLKQRLDELDGAEIERLDGDDQALWQFLTPFIPQLARLESLLTLPLATGDITEAPSALKAGIKGRKWQQIQNFAALVPEGDDPVLEWCAGKGHLGRLIAHQQQRTVESVEWQQILCDNGQQSADKWSLPQQFHQADVLLGEAKHLINPDQQIVSLHACGELHMSLLRQASARRSRRLLLSPCCYHLVPSDCYQPLSQPALASALRLSKHDLNLPLQQVVVAGRRQRRFRATEVAWRLGFDLLQQAIRQQRDYLPLPSIRQSMLTGEFGDFCRWAAQRKGLVLPAELALDHYERAGWQRRELNARIELVCHGFRRAVEIWLLLDRALFLEARGYRVRLARFCSPEVTPRNLLLEAVLD